MSFESRLQQGEHVTGSELAAVFAVYPGRVPMHSFMHTVLAVPSTNIDEVAAFLVERFPDCDASLFLRAQRVFDRRGAADTLALLEPRLSLVLRHDFLIRLYAAALMEAGRAKEAKAALSAFFETYSGDMWREHGFAEAQSEAMSRGIPPVVLCTLPKSGTVFLESSLIMGLKAPRAPLSYHGLFSELIPSRVREVARGGAVGTAHVLAHEIPVLGHCGIRKAVFHYRDVRQAALSMVHHNMGNEGDFSERKRETLRRELAEQEAFEKLYFAELTFMAEMVEGWLRAIEQGAVPFEVLVTRFDELAGERNLLERILQFFDVPEGAFDWSVLSVSKEARAGHFRRGLRDEWRTVLSPAALTRIDDVIAQYPHVAAELTEPAAAT
jgi:hypothetical protein